MASIARSFVPIVALGVALSGLVAASLPSRAEGQIASVVRPPNSKRAPVARPAPYDTGSAQTRHPTTQLTSLTAWVDSAVVANEAKPDVAPASAPARSAKPGTTGDGAAPAAPVRHASAARFHNGASAPDTASLLPAIALGGLLTLGAGLAMSYGARKHV
jgi:hypothetical protein